MDTPGVITRKRARTHNLRNKNSNSLQDFEKDIENKKKSKINVSPKNSEQSRTINSLNKPFSEKNTSSEKSKKSYTSNRFRMIKNLKPKANKSIGHNDSVSDIENITCELFNDSSFNLSMNNEQKSMQDLSLNKIVTPKSSPISITLTPQRTTKTPKKSPLHLNSPKTHSRVSLRTPKTPRKLMLSVHSPTIFNNSEKSLKSRKSMNESTLTYDSMSNIKVKLNKLKINQKGIRSSSENILRLSKSPKIVLRSPKKSKSKSSKMGLSSEKNTSFTVLKTEKSPKKGISTKISNRSKKNYVVNKSMSRKADNLDITLTNSNNLSALYKEIISKKPVIILERIPLLENFIRSSKFINNQHPMNSTFNVKQIEKQLFNISNSLKTSFSLSPTKKKELNNINTLNLTSSPQIKRKSHLTVSDNILLHLSPEASSSPLIEKRIHRRSIGLNLTKKTNEFYNSSQNNTINVNEKEKNIANETYELREPKTPYLQAKCRKRKAEERNSDNERDTKRTCKVHFAASESRITTLNNKNAELNPSISLFKPESVNNRDIRKIPIVKSMSRSVSNSSTNKNTQNSEIKKSLFNNTRKIEKTPSSTLNKTKLIGSEEKTDIKVHSAKKIPNFHEIHTKLFSKMESLVDNRIRLIKQHKALKSINVSKLNTQKNVKRSPTKTKNDGYNRFGFKIRKPEATNIVLTKQPPNRHRAAIAFEKRRHGRSLLWWIIHPYSTLRFFWDLLMIITYLYIFIMVPYIMTFHRIAKNTDTESWIIVYPAYVICIIDIILNFITGYVSTDGNEIFLNPVLIAR
ncbi:inactive protein tyrosine kinase pTKL-like isoform X2 [Polistes fuscatus]|nr:inactive protein tyrosine kinase pTKL-like isoform X2 [Polistes fuscatus]XP_043490449.1 inactive protein tyrosine kinase pTKL-like isoform X2 [Polistes fuscatus]